MLSLERKAKGTGDYGWPTRLGVKENRRRLGHGGGKSRRVQDVKALWSVPGVPLQMGFCGVRPTAQDFREKKSENCSLTLEGCDRVSGVLWCSSSAPSTVPLGLVRQPGGGGGEGPHLYHLPFSMT